MKILFIGGTGLISSACSELAVERGHELFLLNRSAYHHPPFIDLRCLADCAHRRELASPLHSH
jgi:nucleoside-diphosphate-sugar epimerase